MRILQVMAGAAQGGAETYFVNLVLAMQRAGFEQQAAIRRHAGRAAQLRAGGVPVTELAFGGFLDWATSRRLRHLAGEFRPDVALTWMGRASAAMPSGPYLQVGRLGGYYNLRNFRRCDHLVCNTPDLVRYCREGGFAAGRVHYVPNFVAWQPREPELRARHDTPAAAPLVLALGRLHENKAFDVLIRAIALLPGLWLWIAGEGEKQTALAELARALGVEDRVRFLGWRADREALFAAADICAVPSRREPFGNVILDAWAAERPLVAAASTGPASFVRDGIDGLLVSVDDADGLAQAIRRLLDDRELARCLVDAGRVRRQAEFSEAGVIARWRELLGRISG